MLDISQCKEGSPIQFTLDLIGSKWAIVILRELFAVRRSRQLLEVSGISTKTLLMRLRELEEFGLVQGRVYAEVPPHVEYSLIERGRENQSVMTALNQLESR
ncbi:MULTISPECIES: winged helix-turn-helix transcriptional regulator [Cyanophyceae]|uniref:winged helix-turn-helix transcriptional regulator n=1 Tax=Cyanophyceae TaxID=3028117 RepID=UPI0016881486|nr:helix-turn-helix domain-containing protein [Trichocoleus sp. FACHB-69]MBD1933507.1 helix-turn-helix transcriptional regulator [Trichocoleus sp. FACHB-69]